MATGFTVMEALNKNSKAGIDETPKGRFRTKDISIFKMYRNSMNFYDLIGIEELAFDILMYGLKQNLELVYDPCEQGEYRITAGERRWLALKMLVQQGYKEFEIATCKLTTPQDADEEQIEIIIANAYRTKSIKDLIEEEQRLKISLERLRESGKKIKGYDLQTGRLRDVISSMLKMSKTKIAQIESVSNNLIPEFKEELNKERLTFSAAYALSGMTPDVQREALGKYVDTGELTYTDICEMKEQKTAEAEKEQIAEQMSIEDVQQYDENEDKGQQVSDSDTEDSKEVAGEEKEEYKTPHPEGITSICYSCLDYSNCNVKTGTCTSCDQYTNKAEAEKTEEQRYSEEQDKIDKETAKKLSEIEQETKMQNLSSNTMDNSRKTHSIRAGKETFENINTGIQNFILQKNNKEYKKDDILEIMEFAEGKYTGNRMYAIITYILEDYTGLEDGYCVMAICPTNENGEALQYADINQICRDIEANGDGIAEAEEYILIDKVVNMVKNGGLE